MMVSDDIETVETIEIDSLGDPKITPEFIKISGDEKRKTLEAYVKLGLTLGVVVVWAVMQTLAFLGVSKNPVPGELNGVVAAIVGYYFGKKV